MTPAMIEERGGAVERAQEPDAEEEPEQGQAQDDARHRERQPGDEVEQAPPRVGRAHDDVGDQRVHEDRHHRGADREHQGVVQRAEEQLVPEHGLPVGERPRVRHVEEAEQLHEGAEEREHHRDAEHHHDQRQDEDGRGRAPPAQGVDPALELAGDGGVAPAASQPLLREDEREHGGQDQDRERGGRVVARHAGDEQIVDRGAEDEEAEGQAQHLLHLEGLERHHRAEQQHRQDGGRHDRHRDARARCAACPRRPPARPPRTPRSCCGRRG